MHSLLQAVLFGVTASAIFHAFHKVDRIIELLEDIDEKLDQLEPVKPLPASIVFSFNGTKMESPMQMLDSQTASIAIAEVDDAKGFAIAGAALDASPAPLWSLDDPSMGALAVAADGQSAVFTPAKPGLVHVQLSASIGGVAIAGTSEDIVVVPGAAASVKLAVTAQ